MNQVKAKFQCSAVVPNPYRKGNTAHFYAVYGQEGENADFSKATPSGNLSMMIDESTTACTFFEQGKSYYLIFNEAQ